MTQCRCSKAANIGRSGHDSDSNGTSAGRRRSLILFSLDVRALHYCRLVFCAIGALIFALPSAADRAPVQREKKRPAAKPRYITGSGVILIRVERISGKVLQATMVKSTGNKILDAAAENAFRNQTMKLNGAPEIRLPITFRIRAD